MGSNWESRRAQYREALSSALDRGRTKGKRLLKRPHETESAPDDSAPISDDVNLASMPSSINNEEPAPGDANEEEPARGHTPAQHDPAADVADEFAAGMLGFEAAAPPKVDDTEETLSDKVMNIFLSEENADLYPSVLKKGLEEVSAIELLGQARQVVRDLRTKASSKTTG